MPIDWTQIILSFLAIISAIVSAIISAVNNKRIAENTKVTVDNAAKAKSDTAVAAEKVEAKTEESKIATTEAISEVNRKVDQLLNGKLTERIEQVSRVKEHAKELAAFSVRMERIEKDTSLILSIVKKGSDQ